MKISIAMCTYNGAKYLSEQLDSIALQTRLPDEIVICDDKSTDNSWKIIQAFSKSVPFVVRCYVNEINMGSTKNFEKAINLCQGSVIVLSDQDDVWHVDKLKRVESIFMLSPKVGAVFSDAEIVDEYLQPKGYSLWEAVGFNFSAQKRLAQGDAMKILLKSYVVTGATLAFRSNFKELILPIPSNWVHDGWIALLIAYSSKLAIVSDYLIKYRQHSQNQIGAFKKNIIEKAIIAVQPIERTAYVRKATHYMSAYERIVAIYPEASTNGRMRLFEGKFKHLRARANLPKSKLRRLPHIFTELINFRYNRYSNGIKSFLKDFFF